MTLRNFVKRALRRGNSSSRFIPIEASSSEIELLSKCAPFTMTSNERLWSTISASKYVIHNKVPGAFVECGVWRGGSTMAMLGSLVELSTLDREIYLFDTFEGMTAASNLDTDLTGVNAQALMIETEKTAGNNIWCIAGLDDVRSNLSMMNYPDRRFHFIVGDVLETLSVQENLPEEIALLRLDTDWYESTKRELEVLFPLLVSGGVCIIDDYGHWSGARKAVDDYLANNQLFPLVHASDYSGRIFVKS